MQKIQFLDDNSTSGSPSEESEASPFIKQNADDLQIDELREPLDKYHLVYLIVLLHGVGVLLPWNTFLTIAVDVRSQKQ